MINIPKVDDLKELLDRAETEEMERLKRLRTLGMEIPVDGWRGRGRINDLSLLAEKMDRCSSKSRLCERYGRQMAIRR